MIELLLAIAGVAGVFSFFIWLDARKRTPKKVYPPILIVSTRLEVDLYRKVYPGLLDKSFFIRSDQIEAIEGRRFNRVFVSETVDKNSPMMDYVHRSLTRMDSTADTFPIYLWLDDSNYYDWLTDV